MAMNSRPNFDNHAAHYVIDPEGKRSMDMLSTQFLGYEPVSITELMQEGKNQAICGCGTGEDKKNMLRKMRYHPTAQTGFPAKAQRKKK